MPGRNFLFVPGPTNVPERILRAMNRAMEALTARIVKRYRIYERPLPPRAETAG